jgi:predicted phage terminase large subunit-like protein
VSLLKADNRRGIITMLLNNPYKLGHAVGFTKLNSLNNDWIVDMIRGVNDETLQAHRGSYKTTCVSIALSIIIILFPNVKTMFMRKTDDDIKEVVTQVKMILLHPVTREIVNQLYGVELKLIKASTTEITTNLTNDPRGTAQLVGMGIGGSLTGKHFDRIFTDDIVNVKDRVSRAEREHTKLIYQELQNIKNRGGRIFNTGTPWAKDDCFVLMPNPQKWDCYSTGLMSDEEIEDIRAHMLGSLFAANYELLHIASEDVIFTDPRINADRALAEQGFAQVDCAYGGADFTAMTICHKVGEKYYVFGKLWAKHCEDCENEIIQLYNKFMCSKLYNESNADKGFFAKKLRTKGVKVVSYPETMNKFMKITSYLRDEWDNVYFVEGTDKEYIEQICEYNEEAEHDDAPDSLASAIRVKWNKKSDYIPIWNV